MKQTSSKISAIILLTFSVVCYGQQDNFPYSRNKKDLILLPLGAATFVASQYVSRENDRNLSVDEISSLDRNTVNGFDRTATYNWDQSADTFSDIVLFTTPALPLVFVIPQLKNKKWDHAATLGVMYVEVFLFTKGINDLTKSLAGRTRPYLYNTAFTAEERFAMQGDGPHANASFFSGHSSATFAAAVLFSKMYTDIYGKGTWSKIIWGTTLTLAAATATCRVVAGKHFPTDVIVGAIAGSTIGYAIPVLHKRNYHNKWSLSVLPGSFKLGYKF